MRIQNAAGVPYAGKVKVAVPVEYWVCVSPGREMVCTKVDTSVDAGRVKVSRGKEVVSSKVLMIVSAARVCVMFSYCVSVPLGKEVVSSSVLIRVCVILSYRVSVPLGKDFVSSSVLTIVSAGNVCVILS